MKIKRLMVHLSAVLLLWQAWGCKMYKEVVLNENRIVPASYAGSTDTVNAASVNWRSYYNDPNLQLLIDTALKNNQELNITLQEIEIARNEVKARKGEYLPYLGLHAGAGADKSGKYTWNGQSEEDWKTKTHEGPAYIGEYNAGVVASWELDVFKKLRNAKKASLSRYLATIEGRNYMVTRLISEIADTYYELLALDNQLELIRKNIAIQQNALYMIQQQKEAARVTQLAVNRFEAQVLNTQNLQYDIQQQITETENRLNFLTGRYPQPVTRNPESFNRDVFKDLSAGIPSQLLLNRPDIRQAEQELEAAKLDVKTARSNFLPNFSISAGIGYQAFHPSVWFNPASVFYSVLGEMTAPLINRNNLVATYNSAKAKQVQAVYKYEQRILNAYTEVKNQLSGIENYSKSLQTKSNEASILSQAVTTSDNLFKSARADYVEVLLTQREALESRMELIEIRKKLLNAEINIYQVLGGGWK